MTIAERTFPLLRPLLHALDAETAHRLTVAALQLSPPGSLPQPPAFLGVDAFGLHFAHPLGLAAGFDKNGEVPDQMLAQGLSFVEVGTVTPEPQAGNPRPRLFRLSEDGAVINRMGFNNEGHRALHRRLERRRSLGGIVGVNIGANKDSSDRVADYVQGFRAFADIASYLTVNISSPNTAGLRNLQAKAELEVLLGRLAEARAGRLSPALLVKIAPDLDDHALDDAAEVFLATGTDGVIVSNTTLSRPDLHSALAKETGGLSGRPLFALSTWMLARLFQRLDRRMPLVGVGGIDSVETAWTKIEAGATLLQLYSALVFKGPALITGIVSGLAARLAASQAKGFADIVGSKASSYQKRPGI